MRISGVTGDLPAVAQAPEPPPPAPPQPAAAAPAVAAAASPGGADAGTSRDPRQERAPILRAFDPPLIAQRAVLGLPVGQLIAELAEMRGIPFSAACAAVDREMPLDAAS